MPKTKPQGIIFGLMMVTVMVYAMVLYNLGLKMGGLTMRSFGLAAKEFLVEAPIALAIEMLLVERAAKAITARAIDIKKTQPIIVTLFVSGITVAFMCPTMSLIASVMYSWQGIEMLIPNWLMTVAKNFPMALFWQIFFAGPLVRFIFGSIFNGKSSKAAAKN